MAALAHPLLDATDALLVDLDGTLVDSDAPVRRAWTAFALRQGLDPEDVLRIAQGRPSRETVRDCAGRRLARRAQPRGAACAA